MLILMFGANVEREDDAKELKIFFLKVTGGNASEKAALDTLKSFALIFSCPVSAIAFSNRMRREVDSNNELSRRNYEYYNVYNETIETVMSNAKSLIIGSEHL